MEAFKLEQPVETIDLEWNGVRFVGPGALLAMRALIELVSGWPTGPHERILIRLDESSGQVISHGSELPNGELRMGRPRSDEIANFRGAYLDELEGRAVIHWNGIFRSVAIPTKALRGSTEEKLAFVAASLAMVVRAATPA